MDVATVMAELATRLDAQTSGVSVFGYPPERVVPPALIVSYPESITYDATMGRGSDSMTIPVVAVVGKVVDSATRGRIGEYADGSGSGSVKAILEGGTYTSFHYLRVSGVEFDVVTIGGVDYMAALFDVDITGGGS